MSWWGSLEVKCLLALMFLELPPVFASYLPYFYTRIFEYTDSPIVFNFFGDQHHPPRASSGRLEWSTEFVVFEFVCVSWEGPMTPNDLVMDFTIIHYPSGRMEHHGTYEGVWNGWGLRVDNFIWFGTVRLCLLQIRQERCCVFLCMFFSWMQYFSVVQVCMLHELFLRSSK